MADIVTRLRDRAYSFKGKDPLCEEAADEIESLRRKLAAIERFAETGNMFEAIHDAVPEAIAPADSCVPRRAVDRESVGTDKADPLTRDCGTGDISEAQIDALECVVEDGRIVGMSVYGHLRSLLVRLRPEWESDRPKPVKDCDSDRSKPISDDRLSALEELSAMDQELELKHGITGNPMIKARRNKESAGAGITDAGPRLRQMSDVLEENERLRGQLAWTERERDSLRVSINNLRDYVSELNAELFAASAAKTDTTPQRNGALSDGPDPDSRVWETPRTPPPQATPQQGSVPGERGFRQSRNAKEPTGDATGEPGGKPEGTVRAGNTWSPLFNPKPGEILPKAVVGFEYDEYLREYVAKMGDGKTAWKDLPKMSALMACDSRTENEPVAWAVMERDGFGIECTFTDRDEAAEWCDSRQQIVPFYRSPTITDDEREAVGRAVDWLDRWQATHGYHSSESGDLATLRGLLERLK